MDDKSRWPLRAVGAQGTLGKDMEHARGSPRRRGWVSFYSSRAALGGEFPDTVVLLLDVQLYPHSQEKSLKKASKKPRAALHVFSVICLRASRGELLVVGGQGETPAPLPQAGGNYRTTTTTCCEVLSSRLSLTCTHRLSAGSPQ